MPSELNVSTIQQAIQALATIKAKVYDAARDNGSRQANTAGQAGAAGQSDIPGHIGNEEVTVTPSIVAVDNYIGGNGSTENIVSLLLEEPQEFNVSWFIQTQD